MDSRSDIWLGAGTIKPRSVALSDRVWGMPEVCYTEARSAAGQCCAAAGYVAELIEERLTNLPTPNRRLRQPQQE
jgi:aminobenzoyl-glutamate utilization protein B